MKIDGEGLWMVPVEKHEGIPVELRVAGETISVWIDTQGLHFRQFGGRAPTGYLSWSTALAMSMLPTAPKRPSRHRAA